MTTTMQDQSSVRSPRGGWAARILVREMWATLAIVAMWVAVLFVGVYGGEATFHGVDSSFSSVPSGVFVALFAAIGTGSSPSECSGASQINARHRAASARDSKGRHPSTARRQFRTSRSAADAGASARP